MPHLLLVRHGQSEWNARGRWQGQADPPLSDLGRTQALQAARAVGLVDTIVASTLVRAAETAEHIAAAIGVGPVLLESALIERDAGEWSGLTKVEIERHWPGYLDSGDRPPGYEPEGPFRARVFDALDAIAAASGTGDVLVVTHGGVIYAVESVLGASWRRIPNLGGRWLELDENGNRTLGDRVDLVTEEASITVPDQL